MDISYELARYDISPDDLSAERAAEALGMPPSQVYKTIVVRTDRSGIVEACIPADDEVDLKALAATCGSKSAEPVRVAELPALTGYIRGGCSPLGGRRKYPVYIQQDVLDLERFSINAGERGLLFIMSPRDLIRAAEAIPADITKKRR